MGEGEAAFGEWYRRMHTATKDRRCNHLGTRGRVSCPGVFVRCFFQNVSELQQSLVFAALVRQREPVRRHPAAKLSDLIAGRKQTDWSDACVFFCFLFLGKAVERSSRSGAGGRAEAKKPHGGKCHEALPDLKTVLISLLFVSFLQRALFKLACLQVAERFYFFCCVFFFFFFRLALMKADTLKSK